MKTWKKIILGIATCWPIVFVLGAMVVGHRLYLTHAEGSPLPVNEMRRYLVPSVLPTGLLVWGLLAFYLNHLRKSDAIPAQKKRFWIALLFWGNMVTMPLYWYLYVWRQAGSGSPPGD